MAYQVHDRFQEAKQAAFFELAPGYGLRARRLLTTAGERQRTKYSSPDAEGAGAEEDVTRQVQLWELVRATREPA